MSDENNILPKEIEVKLGASSYERRKAAASEVENLIKAHNEQGDGAKIKKLIGYLGDEYVRSPQPNFRKGGLLGLATCAVALKGNAKLHLDLLVEPVLKCFDDPESRVRYYACESMYNIAKITREALIETHFNKLFDGLCKLCLDVHLDVKNGAQLLDRLLKDIVTESDTFDITTFILLLQKYITQTNPYIRGMLVMWINALDSVPSIDMLEWLPTFLDGLFNMLSDQNRQIRQAADLALGGFLKEIKAMKTHVEFGPCEKSQVGMISILVSQCKSRHNFNRVTAVQWIYEFIALGKEELVPFYPVLVEGMLHCISDAVAEIKENAAKANEALIALVRKTEEKIDLKGVLEKLTVNLLNDNEPTRLASLSWICMLLEKLPQDMSKEMDIYFFALLRTLNDDVDDIVILDIQVLALICKDNSQDSFRRVLKEVYNLFQKDQILLEKRASLVVRHFCQLLSPERVYRELAHIVSGTEDLTFAALIVQMLNIILLTARELEPLRIKLRNCEGVALRDGSTKSSGAVSSKLFSSSNNSNNNGSNKTSNTQRSESRSLFTVLYNSWCHSPVSALSLCFLAQAYDLASVLINHFAKAEISVSFLMQVDKLVQLLESPIFIHVRLEMLEQGTPRHFALMKTLYGILMLLPQSAAFKTLQNRLQAVSSMPHYPGGNDGSDAVSKSCVDFTTQFVDVLQQHENFRNKVLADKGL